MGTSWSLFFEARSSQLCAGRWQEHRDRSRARYVTLHESYGGETARVWH